MRLLASHAHVHIDVLTADRSVGLEFKQIYPQFSYNKHLPLLSKWEDSQSQIEASDVVFCCLPHGTTQEIISILAKSSAAKIIDLSADFRLKDINSYAKWYGKEHAAPELQKEAVYGLSEVRYNDVVTCLSVCMQYCSRVVTFHVSIQLFTIYPPTTLPSIYLSIHPLSLSSNYSTSIYMYP